MEFSHTSVMLCETVESLNIKPDGIYVDATLGGAGHSFAICSRLNEHGRLIGIDQDKDAITAATKRLEPFESRVRIVQSNYEHIAQVLDGLGIDRVDGIMLDLGVSSYQLDNPERGFTYRELDAPLDMRMDQGQLLSAKEIVNEWSEAELFRIIRDYGEEKFAKNIARNICEGRKKTPLVTTGDLIAIIRASIPMRSQMTGGHPAKRTFQAIRIACNRELEVLSNTIDLMIDRLKPEGRLSIITFHSLEDRIVKSAFRIAQSPCICPPNFPVCVCGRVSKGHTIGSKPILPSERELEENPRSKSAKLRSFERSKL